MKKIVLIPAFNEEKSIQIVVNNIRECLPDFDTIVIDDGSSDKTAIMAKEAGAKVICLPFNLGIGGAMQTGYIYALEKGYDIAVQIDGDGQHLPSEVVKLLDLLSKGNDLVIGSRFLIDSSYDIPVMRKFGKNILSFILFCLTGKKISDPTSGFRAANAKLIKYFAGYYPQDYPEVESILLAHKSGFKIIETPVNINQRVQGLSSITPFRAAYYMIKVILALVIINLNRRDNNGH